jgi:hypothetical protein
MKYQGNESESRRLHQQSPTDITYGVAGEAPDLFATIPAFDEISTDSMLSSAIGAASTATSVTTITTSAGVTAAGVTTAGLSAGFVIIPSYDTSITNLGTTSAEYIGLTTAINAAIGFFESHITNPVTITIDFGFGEVAGEDFSPGALGLSAANRTTVPYGSAADSGLSTLGGALRAHGDPSFAVPVNNPANGGQGQWQVTVAEALALGLPVPAGSDPAGYAAISATTPLSFDPSNRAVPGTYDAIGVFEHEISEVLGRVSSDGNYAGDNVYRPLDLFRYTAAVGNMSVPPMQLLTPGPAYFSVDGGVTALNAFNDPADSGGDAGDWLPDDLNFANDAFDAYVSGGQTLAVSAADLTVLNMLGYSLATACYAAGTRILGPQGEIRVEDLVPGDLVRTRFAGVVPVKWAGYREIDCRRHPDPRLVWPIRIAADAFGPGRPRRALYLSPDHAVAVGGALIPIRLLVNGGGIRQETGVARVRYHHIELDRHDILIADGLEAESYLDTGNRGLFANAGAPLLLHPGPDDPAARETGSCLPFHHDPAWVEPVWHALAERSRDLGLMPPAPPMTDDPALCIMIGERCFAPVARYGDRHDFVLPVAPNGARLRSRHTSPSDAAPWIDDRRRLGVAVRRITVRDGGGGADIALDDPRLASGWWPLERTSADLWRWTNGDAALPVLDRPVVIEVTLAATGRYPLVTPDWIARQAAETGKATAARRIR